MAAVTLVDIPSNSAASLPDQSSNSSPSSRPPIQFSILSLPDPANDTDDGASERDYMLVSSAHRSTANNSNKQHQQPYDIYELQTVLPHSGKYASYFVGSRIISNPALHVSTRVDPLYFALAHFTRCINTNNKSSSASGQALDSNEQEHQLHKWQPWDQALEHLPSPILHALNLDPKLTISGLDGVGQLGHLLDVSDMCGDDLILCKFSSERTLKWLVAKFDRAVGGLRKRYVEKKRRGDIKKEELSKMQGGNGAFSSSFNLADDENKPTRKEEEKVAEGDGNNEAKEDESSLSTDEEQSIKVGALQLICEYIPTEWRSKLAKEVGLSDDDWMMTRKKTKSSASTSATTTEGESNNDSNAGEKRPRASWEGNIGQEDANALLQYTVGGGGGGGKLASVTPNDKNSVKNAQSVGLKRLAKVNTKGMKSLTSFFGAGKKKKTTK